MSALNTPSRDQRAHVDALNDWLTMGTDKSFVRCTVFSDQGVVPVTMFISNYAHLALTRRSWCTDWAEATGRLLGHYVDRGIVALDARLHMPQAGCTDWEHAGRLPLQIAMVSGQAQAAEVLIAKGALEVTDLRTLESPAQTTTPPSHETREEAFERWCRLHFPNRADVRARLVAAAMAARIAAAGTEGDLASVPGVGMPDAGAPSRRRRSV